MSDIQQWEYHRLFIDAKTDDVSSKLNEVGIRGWEMTGIIPLVNSNFVWFIFKRPLDNKQS
jgi:hypothetical protein